MSASKQSGRGTKRKRVARDDGDLSVSYAVSYFPSVESSVYICVWVEATAACCEKYVYNVASGLLFFLYREASRIASGQPLMLLASHGVRFGVR